MMEALSVQWDHRTRGIIDTGHLLVSIYSSLSQHPFVIAAGIDVSHH